MGIMTFLRNRAGTVVVGAIGVAIFAFLLMDLMGSGQTIFGSNQNEIGAVNDQGIDYQTFNAEIEAAASNMAQQTGGNINPQMRSYLIENIWNRHVSRTLLNEEVENIGLAVGKSELNDLVTGQNPSQVIRPYFTNQQTGEFDRDQLNLFLNTIQNEPDNSERKQQWGQLLEEIKANRLQEKYNDLLQNSVYITSLEAKEEYTQRNKIANFSYVLLDYASIPDKDINLTDADYQNYYNDHKASFINDVETRSIAYIVVNALPTSQDSIQAKQAIDEFLSGLKNTDNDSLYASVNSETKYPVTYRTKGGLEPKLDSALFSAAKGEVVGPILNNGTYEIAKVIDVRMSPDSVTASHILLNPAMEGGLDKAQAKADSIKNLIQQGESFAKLAAQFGTDGTKDNEGKLGTFARGSMIPEFEEAVFNGKPGDLLVLTTQYGVHVIKINAQKGMSKVVKAAIIDRSIKSSNETLQTGYAKASDFFGKATKDNFEQLATENGFEVKKGENIVPMQSQIQDLVNPRDLIRWAFSAEVGDISDKVYDLNDKYIVAKLTGIKPEGTLTLEEVKKEIEPMVLKEVKAAKLIDKFNTALSGATSLEQIGKKLDKKVNEVENVVFANPIIPGIAQENEVVGTAFGLQPATISKPIVGNQGVFVLRVKDFVNPEAPKDLLPQKQQIRGGLVQRISQSAYQVLVDLADIKDNRIRFY